MDCFASLAMTAASRFDRKPLQLKVASVAGGEFHSFWPMLVGEQDFRRDMINAFNRD
jgi:hypothetical protein